MGESTSAPYYKAAGAVLHHNEALAVLRSLPEHSVDALVTDPPYSGIADGRSANSKYQTTKTPRYPEFAGDNRDQRSDFIWWTLWGTECLRLLKPGAPVLVFSDWRQYPVVSDALQVAGFVWRGTLAWDKTPRCHSHPRPLPPAGRVCPVGIGRTLPQARRRRGAGGRVLLRPAGRRQASRRRQAGRLDGAARRDLPAGRAGPGPLRRLGFDRRRLPQHRASLPRRRAVGRLCRHRRPKAARGGWQSPPKPLDSLERGQRLGHALQTPFKTRLNAFKNV